MLSTARWCAPAPTVAAFRTTTLPCHRRRVRRQILPELHRGHRASAANSTTATTTTTAAAAATTAEERVTAGWVPGCFALVFATSRPSLQQT